MRFWYPGFDALFFSCFLCFKVTVWFWCIIFFMLFMFQSHCVVLMHYFFRAFYVSRSLCGFDAFFSRAFYVSKSLCGFDAFFLFVYVRSRKKKQVIYLIIEIKKKYSETYNFIWLINKIFKGIYIFVKMMILRIFYNFNIFKS